MYVRKQPNQNDVLFWIIVFALVLWFLSGCTPPQPPGGDLYKIKQLEKF
jgi:hypothetical protein